jgi:anaphase-promoting complex subunit 3
MTQRLIADILILEDKHTDTRRQAMPDAAAVQCLQGKLWRAYHDTNRAIECYAEALKLNPFMWDAFLDLCDLGVSLAKSRRNHC